MTWGEAASLLAALASSAAVVLSIANQHKIQDIHLLINSRMDQLLKTTGDFQLAKGRQEGLRERG